MKLTAEERENIRRAIIAPTPGHQFREDTIGSLLADLEASEQTRAALRDALTEARETIHAFHGEVGWEIYVANAPEMKRMNAAFAKDRELG